MNAAMQNLFNQLNEQREAIQRLSGEVSALRAGAGGLAARLLQFPEIYWPGVIKYPDCKPWNMIFEIEMESKSGEPFGVAVEESVGTSKFDIDDPVYLVALRAAMYKSHGTIGQGLPDPGIGYWRPLSMDCCNPGTPLGFTQEPAVPVPVNYFCDFEWKAHFDTKQRIITYEWAPSTFLQTDNKRGYVLPIQQEMKKNETLTITAQPLRAVQNDDETGPDGQGYTLKFYAITYKMLPDPDKVIDRMNQAETASR